MMMVVVATAMMTIVIAMTMMHEQWLTRAMIMMTMTNSFSKNLKADHSCYHFDLSKALTLTRFA
jgi:hypothetical protein